MIRLQFSTEPGIYAAIIRGYTHSRFSHVDIVLPSGGLLGARFHGGVRIRSPNYAAFSYTQDFGVEIPATSEPLFYALARQQIGKPYDLTAVLGFPFPRNWREPGQWFCSELVAWLFERVSFPVIRARNNDKISPRDLTLSFLLSALP